MFKYFKLKPLFCSCILAIVCSIICSFTNVLGMVILIAAILLLTSVCIFVKADKILKSYIYLASVLSVFICVINLLYYCFIFIPVSGYTEETVTAECLVIECEDDFAKVLFLKDNNDINITFKSYLYFDEKVNLFPSSKISVTATFLDNNKRRFANNGVHSSAIVGDYSVINLKNDSSPIYMYFRFRQALSQVLDNGDEQVSAFINGILLGDTDDVSGILSNKLQSTGLSHVMSVSGLHLMFAVLFMDKLLILLGLSIKKRSIVSIIAAFLFALISGFAVACVRSFIMVSLCLYARIVERIPDELTSLGISAYLILIFTPYNLYNISFILSVLATYGMIAISPILSAIFNFRLFDKNLILNKLVYFIKQTIIISLSANIACIPVMLIVFKRISLISPIVNLIVAIPIQILFYSSFALMFLFFLPFVKDVIFVIINLFYRFIVNFVDFCYNIKCTSITVGNKYFYFVTVILLAIIFGSYLLKRFNGRISIKPYLFCYLALCIILFTFTKIDSRDSLKVKFVDVGHGSASLISKDEIAVIVDCGGYDSSGFSEELIKSNIKRIELIAITHADNDHINFITDILDKFEVDKIIFPSFCNQNDLYEIMIMAQSQGTDIEILTNDKEFKILNSASIYAYVDKAYDTKINNNTSALYKFQYNDTDICFTGDMSINQEYAYLDYGDDLDCDLLLVSHHGSKTGSYYKILELYSPDYSIISVSDNKLFGLPNENVVNRLKEYSRVLTTAENSTITFKINNKGYELLKNEC